MLVGSPEVGPSEGAGSPVWVGSSEGVEPGGGGEVLL